MAGFLERTTSGIIRKALRVVLYGEAGVGKTSFASQAPSPYFIGAEDGSSNLNVNRFAPTCWGDILGVLDELATREHPFQTVVLDSANWAQKFCYEHICKANNVESIEGIGYGKGYVLALVEFEKLLGKLDALNLRGINIIIIAHEQITRFDDPAGESYSVYSLATDKKITPLLVQWPDAVLFANYDKTVKSVGQGLNSRKVAKSYGERIMFTENRASHLAKNRFSLPERMPLNWGALVQGVEAYFQNVINQQNQI